MELMNPYKVGPDDLDRASRLVIAVMMGYSYKDVGETLGLSGVRVRQTVLKMCRTYMKKEYLAEQGDIRALRKRHKNRITARMNGLITEI